MPDPDHTPASELQPYSCSFSFEDAVYQVTVYAAGWEDAAERLHTIGTGGRVDGVLVHEEDSGPITFGSPK